MAKQIGTMDYHIDANKKTLGRLASEISLILQGKKSASYERNRVSDDKVYVKNVDGIVVTGNKATQKIYYHHTGYVGHLKELTYEQQFAKDPRKVLREAVRKMLPKNFLNQKRLKNLVFVQEGAKGVATGGKK
ncbi:MAG TPA: 50S ribosomal protein L13 [Candidatus Paceibacterota bacterium]|jgi:large subunit ribosomal protein L13|nr:50S ribosomal protein L13 [Candidatus Paceibacterota bacterium]